jgi:predicted RNA methylase
VSTTAQRIARIADDARGDQLDTAAAIEQLAQVAQERGGTTGRRGDGAFFTDHDVARHLARRALVATLLEAAGRVDVDELLAHGADLHETLRDVARDLDASARMAARLTSLVVLDPTCGAGAFLLAAWEELAVAAQVLGASVSPAQLHGVDLDPDAVAACRATLELAGAGATSGDMPSISLGDAESSGSLPAADLVLGNPPFVRATADARHVDLCTERVPNRSAWIVERAIGAARPGARIAFVLPISTSCTDAFQPARRYWSDACSSVHVTHFDTIPASLFTGVVQRVSFFEGRVRTRDDASPSSWWTSRYHRWLREERGALLNRVQHVPLPAHDVGGSIAKVGTELESRLLDRIFAHPPAGRHFTNGRGSSAAPNRVLYKRRWSYFLLFTDFVPAIWNEDGSERPPTELKAIDVDPALDARVLLAVFSSTLFWWYFSVFTDNRNVNRRDLAAFPLPDLDDARAAALAALGAELMEELRACAEVRTCTYRSIGTIHNTYFRQGATRPVLDRIDRELAAAYGMSDEQLEFVLGFERRFRS